MRKSRDILRRTLTLGLVGALALAGLNCQAREPARPNVKPAAIQLKTHTPAPARMGSWATADGLDVSWDVAGHSVRRPPQVTLKRGTTRDATRSPPRRLIDCEGFASLSNSIPMETVTIAAERIQRVSP